MKPKDLKKVFSFEERRPLFEDRIFYVPIYYSGYEFFKLSPLSVIFENTLPVCIEYCSGNGDWIVNKALEEPTKNWIAVELRFDRVRKIWSKIKNHNITNLIVVCGEAFTFTNYYLLNEEIEEVYINFPDPWPKLKHAKKRLIRPLFLNELARILQPGKKITFVTDDQTYLNEVIVQFSHHPNFFPVFPPPYYTNEISDYGRSWFENLWRKKGKQINYTQFYKKNHESPS